MGVAFGGKSIRKRLVAYFILIIVITVVILEILLIGTVRRNYYKNLEIGLYNQIKLSSDLYYKYFSDVSLYDNVLNNVDTFWKQSSAQVEIIDGRGRVLMDSIGVLPGSINSMPDVKRALTGSPSTWIGNVDYSGEKVMAVSYPLKSGDKIDGVLRFISSLREVNNEIRQITILFIAIGILVTVLSAGVSFLFASSIVNPLRNVTRIAQEMASGNLSVQSSKVHDDEIGKLSDTLNYMAEEINKRERLKDEFIASVSHELRTPLTSIKGWSVTLQNGSDQDSSLMKDGLDIIEKESDRLTSMVEELLDFSRLVSGKISIKNELVDIEETVRQVSRQLAPRALREDINFRTDCQLGQPRAYTDENRLKQLFINILDNAFKFTGEKGEVVFESSFVQGEYIFKVSDTGCGISEDDLPRVKEKFFKGRNSKSNSGIGLSICDEIVRLMGGTMDIQSGIGRGTEVTIRLPLAVEVLS